MGETGADIKLSHAAQQLVPYSFECKNTETGFTAVYKAYDQAVVSSGKLVPIVVFKQNHRSAMVTMNASDFFELIKG